MDPILEHMDRQLAQHGGYDSEADSESGGVKNEEDFVFVWQELRYLGYHRSKLNNMV